jgi:WD repeat-containing protein 1 (actin-interacting protein 1)
MGSDVTCQQVGNAWAHGSSQETLITIGLSGNMHYLDPKSGGITRTITGHQKPITSRAFCPSLPISKKSGFVTACSSGRVLEWDNESGTAKVLEAVTSMTKGAAVTDIAVLCEKTGTLAVSTRNAMCHISQSPSVVDDAKNHTVSLASAGMSVCKASASGDSVCVGTLEDGAFLIEKENDSPTPLIAGCDLVQSVSTDGKIELIALASRENGRVSFLKSHNAPITPHIVIESGYRGVSAISFSHDAKKIAIASATGPISIYSIDMDSACANRECELSGHSGRVQSVSFSKDGNYAVSCGVDSQIFVWNTQNSHVRVVLRNSHRGVVYHVDFTEPDSKTLSSTGEDGCIKRWKLDRMP